MRTKTIIMTICGLLVSTCLTGTGVGLFLRNKKGRESALSPQLSSNKISPPVNNENSVGAITNRQEIKSVDSKKSDSFSEESTSGDQICLSVSVEFGTPNTSIDYTCSNNFSKVTVKIEYKPESSFSDKNIVKMEDVYAASCCFGFFV